MVEASVHFPQPSVRFLDVSLVYFSTFLATLAFQYISSYFGSSRFCSLTNQATKSMVCIWISVIPHSKDWNCTHRRESAHINSPSTVSWFLFFFNFIFFKLYNIVLAPPNIEMNPPQVHPCPPSWNKFPYFKSWLSLSSWSRLISNVFKY